MTITQAFGLFLDDQYLKGNSLHTITDYTNKLRPFLEQLCNLYKLPFSAQSREVKEGREDMLTNFSPRVLAKKLGGIPD